MRFVVLIVGLLSGVVLAVQALLSGVLTDAVDAKSLSSAAAGALLVPVFWITGSVGGIRSPMLAAAGFTLAGALALLVTGTYSDLTIWGFVGIVLAGISLIGYSGRPRLDLEESPTDLFTARAKAAQAVQVQQVQLRGSGGPDLSNGGPSGS